MENISYIHCIGCWHQIIHTSEWKIRRWAHLKKFEHIQWKWTSLFQNRRDKNRTSKTSYHAFWYLPFFTSTAGPTIAPSKAQSSPLFHRFSRSLRFARSKTPHRTPPPIRSVVRRSATVHQPLCFLLQVIVSLALRARCRIRLSLTDWWGLSVDDCCIVFVGCCIVFRLTARSLWWISRGYRVVAMATRIAVRYVSRRLSSSGKILSEEERAAENVYIKVLSGFFTSSLLLLCSLLFL